MEDLTDSQEKLDELIYLSDTDAELKEALVWVDEQALKKGVSMLEMMNMILLTRKNRLSARQWVQSLQKKSW